MDTKTYIESSILELYVLGAVSDQERREVECMSKIYPEIKEALERLQQDVERAALEQAVATPSELKGKVMSAIEGVEQVSKETPDALVAETETKVVEMRPPMFSRIAATIIFLLIAGLVALFLNSQRSASALQAEMDELSSQNTALATKVETIEGSLTNELTVNRILASASTAQVNLAGTDNSPESSVRIFWDVETEEVLMKVDALPDAPSGKQYQLWAIVDGAPLDMGVFDLSTATDSIQLIPTNVSGAAAFAITLEDEGGKPTPDLSQLYVIGNV